MAAVWALIQLKVMSTGKDGAPVLLPGDWWPDWPDWVLDAVIQEFLRPLDDHRKKGSQSIKERCELERVELKTQLDAIRAKLKNEAIRAPHKAYTMRAAAALYLEQSGEQVDPKAIDNLTRRLRRRRRPRS